MHQLQLVSPSSLYSITFSALWKDLGIYLKEKERIWSIIIINVKQFRGQSCLRPSVKENNYRLSNTST